MAVIFDDSNYIFSGLPIIFSRNNPAPLDKTEVWDNLDNLKDYAKNNPTAYVGQVLTYVDRLNRTAVAYVISNENGDIQELGANSVSGLESRLDGIDNILNGDTGLVTTVGSLETQLESVKNSISSVFRYKGTKDSYSDLLLIDSSSVGDVWSVGAAEYAWNGTDWIELGSVVDLSNYYTKTEIDAEIKKVQDTVAQNTEAIANNGLAIENLQSADTAISRRIEVVEDYIGTPSGDLGALYPVVESLNERLNNIVAEGGEPNQLNGIIIDGSKLVPNDSLLVTLPTYNGTGSGLVPVISDDLKTNGVENYFLNAQGSWAVPMDSRIGELGDFNTVVDYVDNAISAAMTWGTIV